MDKLRQELSSLNFELKKSLDSRQQTLDHVIELKKSNEVAIFDAVQEQKVWRGLTFEKMEEARIFSQIIETQGGSDYPKWSLGVHLQTSPRAYAEQINPVLLGIHFPSILAELPLNQEWRSQMDALFSPR